MRTKKTIKVKYLFLIVITCFLLSLLISFLLDTSSSSVKRTSMNIQKDITSQQLEKLEREGITLSDLERLSREYDKKRNK